jgi:glycosyltransferase involved in cell wall biosynthesis
MDKYELSIAIPFYNEEGNIENVAKSLASELKNSNVNYELILVDNGSSDSTLEIIKRLKRSNPRIKLVHVPKNQGYGWGIIQGLDTAKGKYIGFIDGDDQVHPKYLIQAYNKIRETNSILCITRRLKRPSNLFRQAASLGYNALLNILFFLGVPDVNSKPKIMLQKFYKQLSLSSKDWFIDTEIILKAKRKNFKIAQVPVIYYERKEGKSNVRLSIIKEFLSNILKYLFNTK